MTEPVLGSTLSLSRPVTPGTERPPMNMSPGSSRATDGIDSWVLNEVLLLVVRWFRVQQTSSPLTCPNMGQGGRRAWPVDGEHDAGGIPQQRSYLVVGGTRRVEHAGSRRAEAGDGHLHVIGL